MFDQTFKTAADTALNQMKQAFAAFGGTPGTMTPPPALKDFAVRAADAAKAGLAEAETASLAAAAKAEKAAVAAAGTGAALMRDAFAGAVANANLVIDATRDVLAAPSLQAALERQVAFAKAFADDNRARAEAGFATLRGLATEGAETLRTEAEAIVTKATKATKAAKAA